VYINRTLLLLTALALVFAPTALEWITQGGTAWYRAWLVWLGIVVLAAWNNRSGFSDDL